MKFFWGFCSLVFLVLSMIYFATDTTNSDKSVILSIGLACFILFELEIIEEKIDRL